MLLTGIAGLLGAFLGVTFASRVWAALTAMAMGGFAHALAVLAAVGWLNNGGDARTTRLVLEFAGAHPADLWSTVAAAGLSALLAGSLAGRSDRRRSGERQAAFDRAQLVGPAGQRIDQILSR